MTLQLEGYIDKAERIARVLREKLTAEEVADLLDMLSDYKTDEWLTEALLNGKVGKL